MVSCATKTPIHADDLKVMASVSDAAGAVGAVRFAAKVRCALVPPKPNEERPSWATGNTGIQQKS